MYRVFKNQAIFVLIGFLAVWAAFVQILNLPPYVLPGPVDVGRAFMRNLQTILWHSGVSFFEIFCGFVIGIGLAVGSSILIDRFKRMKKVLLPILIGLQSIPIFALLPLLLIWFGYGIFPKVIIVALCTYFPVTVAFLDGLARVPTGYLDMASVMKGRRWYILWHIRLPSALPSILSGIRIAAVHAPITVIAADWIGAEAGLGYLMMLSSGRIQIDFMLACTVVLVTLSLSLYKGIEGLQKKIIFWKSEGAL